MQYFVLAFFDGHARRINMHRFVATPECNESYHLRMFVIMHALLLSHNVIEYLLSFCF
jgi:hypothetical protein